MVLNLNLISWRNHSKRLRIFGWPSLYRRCESGLHYKGAHRIASDGARKTPMGILRDSQGLIALTIERGGLNQPGAYKFFRWSLSTGRWTRTQPVGCDAGQIQSFVGMENGKGFFAHCLADGGVGICASKLLVKTLARKVRNNPYRLDIETCAPITSTGSDGVHIPSCHVLTPTLI